MREIFQKKQEEQLDVTRKNMLAVIDMKMISKKIKKNKKITKFWEKCLGESKNGEGVILFLLVLILEISVSKMLGSEGRNYVIRQ